MQAMGWEAHPPPYLFGMLLADNGGILTVVGNDGRIPVFPDLENPDG